MDVSANKIFVPVGKQRWQMTPQPDQPLGDDNEVEDNQSEEEGSERGDSKSTVDVSSNSSIFIIGGYNQYSQKLERGASSNNVVKDVSNNDAFKGGLIQQKPSAISWYMKYLPPVYFSINGGLIAKTLNIKSIGSTTFSKNPNFNLGNTGGALFFPVASAVDMILTHLGSVGNQEAKQNAENELLNAFVDSAKFKNAYENYKKKGDQTSLATMNSCFAKKLKEESEKLSQEALQRLIDESIFSRERDAGLVGWFSNTSAGLRLVPELSKLYGNLLVPIGTMASGALYGADGVAKMCSAQLLLKQLGEYSEHFTTAKEAVKQQLKDIHDDGLKTRLHQMYENLFNLHKGTLQSKIHDQKVKTGHGGVLAATGGAILGLSIAGLAVPSAGASLGLALLGTYIAYFTYASVRLAMQHRQLKHEKKQEADWKSQVQLCKNLSVDGEQGVSMSQSNPYVALNFLLAELGHQDPGRQNVAKTFLQSLGASPEYVEALTLSVQTAKTEKDKSDNLERLIGLMNTGLQASFAHAKRAGGREPHATYVMDGLRSWKTRKEMSSKLQILQNSENNASWSGMIKPKTTIGDIVKAPGWLVEKTGSLLLRLGGRLTKSNVKYGNTLVHVTGHIVNVPGMLLKGAGQFLSLPGNLLNKIRWLSRKESVQDEIALNHQLAKAIGTRHDEMMPFTPKFLLQQLRSAKHSAFAKQCLADYLEQSKLAQGDDSVTAKAGAQIQAKDWFANLAQKQGEIAGFLEAEATRFQLKNSLDPHAAWKLLTSANANKRQGAAQFAQSVIEKQETHLSKEGKEKILPETWKSDLQSLKNNEELDAAKKSPLEKCLAYACTMEKLGPSPRPSQCIAMLQSKVPFVKEATKTHLQACAPAITDAEISEWQQSADRDEREFFSQQLAVKLGHSSENRAIPSARLLARWNTGNDEVLKNEATQWIKNNNSGNNVEGNSTEKEIQRIVKRARQQSKLETAGSGNQLVGQLLAKNGNANAKTVLAKHFTKNDELTSFVRLVTSHSGRLKQYTYIPSFSWFGPKGHATTATFFGSQRDRRFINELLEKDYLGNRIEYAHAPTAEFVTRLVDSNEEFQRRVAKSFLIKAYGDTEGTLDAERKAEELWNKLKTNDKGAQRELKQLMQTEHKILKYASRLNAERIGEILRQGDKLKVWKYQSYKMKAAEMVLKNRGATQEQIKSFKDPNTWNEKTGRTSNIEKITNLLLMGKMVRQ